MLSKNETKTVIWMWKCGNSYEEIAQTLLDTRNRKVLNDICSEIEAYIKGWTQ